MIETEIKVQAQGGRSGRYVIKQADGSEVIVYRASTPRGVVEYPVPLGPESEGVGQRLSAALDNKPVSAGPAPAASAAKTSSKKTGRYTLHLASFQNQTYAREQLQALKAKGVEARLQGVDIPGRGHWHRLLVGKFSSRAQARAEGDKLRNQGSITSFRVMPN
jgi:cell division septation protein DedD